MKITITLRITLIVLCTFFVLPFTSIAQDGSLDLTFGTNGYAITSIPATNESGKSVVIQSDGKIVVAGFTSNGTSGEFALVRYNVDGSLDTTFDTDGKVTTTIGLSCSANTVALQSDGKIVVAGGWSDGLYQNSAIARYNTNGSLDTTFNTDGIDTLNLGTTDDEIFSIAIQSDDKILIAGRSFDGAMSYFSLVRYDNNGILDTTFDTDGIVLTDFGNSMNWAYAVAVQNDGKIVVAGMSGEILGSHFAIARYNTDGSLDNSFDTDGKVITIVGVDYDGGYALDIQSDNKIVVAGYSYNGYDDEFAVVRYNTDGSLDTTFDADGIVVTPFGAFADTPNSVEIQNDGKILVAGYSIDGGGSYYFALARYNSNGSLDSTFDADGKVTTLFGFDSDTGCDIALQSDGKIVMVGSSLDSTGWYTDFAVVRYNNTIITGINPGEMEAPGITIYPNPFSNLTTIYISLSHSQKITLRLFDVSGKLVSTLADKVFEAGENKYVWNKDDNESGIYFLHLETTTYSENRKLIIF